MSGKRRKRRLQAGTINERDRHKDEREPTSDVGEKKKTPNGSRHNKRKRKAGTRDEREPTSDVGEKKKTPTGSRHNKRKREGTGGGGGRARRKSEEEERGGGGRIFRQFLTNLTN